METREFLEKILPDDSGRYYVFAIKGKRGRAYEQVVDTLDAAHAYVDSWNQQKLNVYVATSTLQPDADHREDALSLGKRVLFFDLDVDPNDPKKYDSKKDALTEFREFLLMTGVPVPSFYVDSGHGIHVYWMLDDAYSKSEWQPVADGMHELANRKGLKVDPIGKQITRLMRIPGTLNTKEQGEAIPCRVLGEVKESAYPLTAFRDYIPLDHNIIAMTGATLPANLQEDSGLGTTSTFAPRYAHLIVDECPLMAKAVETGGVDHEEQVWFGLLGILAACEDGESYAHLIGQNHKGYSERDTNYKFGKRVTALDAGKAGPTTCEYLQKYDSAKPECHNCPHWQRRQSGAEMKWTSPIAFGTKKQTFSANTHLPLGLIRDTNQHGYTGLYFPPEDDDTPAELFIQGDIKQFDAFQTENGVQYSFVYNAGGPNAVDQSVRIDGTAPSSPEATDKALALEGVPVLPQLRRNWQILMRSWHQQLQQHRKVYPAHVGMGWVDATDRVGFRIGDTTYWDDGEGMTTPTSDRQVARKFEPVGSYEEWKKVTRAALRAEHIETNTVIASAFAAPVIELLEIDGVVLSVTSRASGTGKTLALKIAQSVWGHPNYTFSNIDTANAMLARMGQLKNLPAYWDEVRIGKDIREQKRVIDMIFQITSGRDKSRLSQTAAVKDVGEWQTMLVCTSNHGLMEYMMDIDHGMTAGANRVLEFDVGPLDTSKMCSKIELRPLSGNYGHAGVQYAKWLAENKAECTKEAFDVLDKLAAKLKTSSEERYLAGAIAATYLGAKWAKQIGIIDLNPTEILKFLFERLQFQRGMLEDMSETNVESEFSPVTIVQSFLQDNQRSTSIARERPGRGASTAGAGNNVLQSAAEFNQNHRAVIYIKDEVIVIPCYLLVEYAKKFGIDGRRKVIESIDGLVKERPKFPNLVKGCNISTQVNCYVIYKSAATSALFPDDDSQSETSESHSSE